MKEVTIEKLKEAANKLLFDMSEQEYQTLLEEFKIILKQMDLLSQDKKIDNYTPMVFPFLLETDALRDDVPSKKSNREEMLKNAKDVVGGQIKVGRVNS